MNRVRKQILESQLNNLLSQSNESALQYELAVFFQKLKESTLKELEEHYPKDTESILLNGQVDLILSPIFEAQQEYYNILRKYNLQEYRLGAKHAKTLVKLAKRYTKGASKSKTSKINPSEFIKTDKDKLFGTSDWTSQRLLEQSFTASERTMNRVDQDINKIITDGYKDGWGIAQVADNITKRYNQLKTWEANRIARTEIHNAHQMGMMNTYKDLEIEYLEWSSARDSRVRTSHRGVKGGVDGEIIPLGATFSNGLEYPGDTKGDISEWINCRCSGIPFIMPAGYAAPPGKVPFKEADLIRIEDSFVEPESIDFSQSFGDSPIPLEVHHEMDKFGKKYEHSKREHMQFFTKSESSEVAHGSEGNVNLSGKQRKFLNDNAKTGEEVHALHNHPTNDTRKEGYTMLSDEDVNTFVSWNVRGDTADIPINMKTSSAENQYNRITIERLPHFHETYKKGIKPEESLGRGTSYAISRAFREQEKFYEKYHPTVSKGRLYLREVRAKLKKKGVRGYELSKELEKYEAKAKQIDKDWFEERQREFPKLIDAMNKELNPYGLHITSEYKLGVHSKTGKISNRSKIKSPNKTQKPEVSSEDLEQLEFLKEQLKMAEKDIKRLSKDDPQYDAIKRMASNTRKKIKELKKKIGDE